MKFLALIALLLLSPLLAAQSDSSFFFIQLADPQFGMYPTGKDFSHERENVSKAVKAINRLKPEFVVVCGDLVNSEGDLKQIAAFREEFRKIDKSIPLYLVAGNHDVGNTPTDSSLLHYRNEFGPDYYTFERRGVRFIVINSSLIMDPAKVPEEARKQEDWLRVQLTNHHSPMNIVFQHHPFFVDNANEPNSYHNLPKETRTRYLDMFLENGVTHVFAGHLHHNARGKYESLEMISSGPIGMPLKTDPSGLRIVKVGPNGVQHEYWPVKKLMRKAEEMEAERAR